MESITLPATLESLAQISDFVTNATARAGLDEHAAWQVQLAVDEAATNIIQHGYGDTVQGDIELGCSTSGDQFVITLRDRGRRFNPHDVPAPDITSPLEERQPGGLGLYIMSRLMDTVTFDFDDKAGNLLTMIKRIDATRADVQIFALSGRLDAVQTDAALKQVREAIAQDARKVLLDMADVTFLSSSGLRALLLVRKELLAHDGELRLCALRPEVQEVFTLTGFIQVFTIHSSRAQALDAFKRAEQL
jgi:serine/threonine-protein kinase RsbW